jgi:hypothetical protein
MPSMLRMRRGNFVDAAHSFDRRHASRRMRWRDAMLVADSGATRAKSRKQSDASD